MIKRINVLRRVGRYTELSSHPGQQGEFAQLTVIYGKNASGKSTLCDVFRSLGTGEAAYIVGRKSLDSIEDPEIVVTLDGSNPSSTARFSNGSWVKRDDVPKIQVFDERFVADNVLIGHQIGLDHRRNLYSLVIGDQAIALNQAVEAAEQRLSNATLEINQKEAALNGLLPEGQTIATFRDIPKTENVDQQIFSAKEALENATRIKLIADQICGRKELSHIPVSDIPDGLDQVLSVSLRDTSLAAEQKIRDHLAATSVGLTIDWLGRGHQAQSGTACPHCGQEMDGLEIFEAYTAFFSGELQEQNQERQGFQNTVEERFGPAAQLRLNETLGAHAAEQAWWVDAVGFRVELPSLPNRASLSEAMADTHRVLTGALSRKQASPGSVVEWTDDETKIVDAWRGIASKLNLYNDGLAAVNDAFSQRKTSAGAVNLEPLQRRLAALELSKKRHQQAVKDAYAAYDRSAHAQKVAQGDKKTANHDLRTVSNQLMAAYGERINRLLAQFNVDFQIVCGGTDDNYVAFPSGRPSGLLAIEIKGVKVSASSDHTSDPSRVSIANTLSGGDRSALALAFFLAKIEADPELSESILVFDDPFHSQDRSRRTRTVERIHQAAKTSKQCIVLSHDLEFARTTAALPRTAVRTFVLDTLSRPANLVPGEFPMLPSQAYEMRYERLCNFLSDPADFANQLNNVARDLRVILEEYLKYKYPRAWAEDSDWLGDMIRKIREAPAHDPIANLQHLVTELEQVNEYSKRFHHRSIGATADTPDATELLSYARQALSIIHK